MTHDANTGNSGLSKLLEPVRSRQRTTMALRTGLLGMLVGAGLALVLALLSILTSVTIGVWAGLAAIAAGMLGGVALGWFYPRGLREAAAAVDTHFDLKDRTVSALHFLAAKEDNPILALQVQDARDHLHGKDLRRSVAMRLPRSAPYGLGMALAAVVLFSLGGEAGGGDTPRAATIPFDPAVRAAEEQEEERKEREEEIAKEFAKKNDPKLREELKKLLEEQEQKIQELKEPGLEQREAIAKVSEMEAAYAAQLSRVQAQRMDAKLSKLGKSLKAAEAFKELGKKMESGEFQEASDELSKLLEKLAASQKGRQNSGKNEKQPDKNGKNQNDKGDQAKASEAPKDAKAVELSPEELRALEEALAKLSKEFANENAGDLAEVTGDLRDALMAEDVEGICEACEGLGEMIDAENLKAGLCKSLKAGLRSLGKCKGGLCKGGGKKPGTKNGGPRNKARDSQSPSNTWGQGIHDDPYGDPTKIASKRNVEKITGKMGQGSSEYEKITSEDGSGQASRGKKARFNEYQRLSEAVLENEAIPLGQRRIIRRYFELIRPRAEDK